MTILELRTYSLVPGGAREYLRLYNEMGRATQVRILGDLAGLFVPETGDLNQLRYLWRFEGFEERARRRAELMADARFAEFRAAVRHLVVRQESQLLTNA
jgi:hypothetical protein